MVERHVSDILDFYDPQDSFDQGSPLLEPSFEYVDRALPLIVYNTDTGSKH
jgi:hypothetical protein